MVELFLTVCDWWCSKHTFKRCYWLTDSVNHVMIYNGVCGKSRGFANNRNNLKLSFFNFRNSIHQLNAPSFFSVHFWKETVQVKYMPFSCSFIWIFKKIILEPFYIVKAAMHAFKAPIPNDLFCLLHCQYSFNFCGNICKKNYDHKEDILWRNDKYEPLNVILFSRPLMCFLPALPMLAPFL